MWWAQDDQAAAGAAWDSTAKSAGRSTAPGCSPGARGDLDQVGDGIDAADLRRLDQAVEDRGGFGASRGLRAEVIAPADDRPADASLSSLGGHLKTGQTWTGQNRPV